MYMLGGGNFALKIEAWMISTDPYYNRVLKSRHLKINKTNGADTHNYKLII